MSRSASERATSGLVSLSAWSSSRRAPPIDLIPPAALMASAAICAPSLESCPTSAMGPDTGLTMPTLIVRGCARSRVGKAVTPTAETVAPRRSARRLTRGAAIASLLRESLGLLCSARISGPAGRRGGCLAEDGIVRPVHQGLVPLRGKLLRVVLGGVDVLLPHFARQLVQHFDAVPVRIGDVHAMGHAVVGAPVKRHALALEELDLLEPGLAVRPGDGHVVDPGPAGHEVPLLAVPAIGLGLLDFGQGEVVMRHVPLRVEAAVEAHLGPLAPRDGLELGHASEADDLGPEPMRGFQVPYVEDEVIDAARRLGLP